jgi:hypothetical protein
MTFSCFHQTVFSFLTAHNLQQLFPQLTVHSNFFHSHSPTKQTLNFWYSLLLFLFLGDVELWSLQGIDPLAPSLPQFHRSLRELLLKRRRVRASRALLNRVRELVFFLPRRKCLPQFSVERELRCWWVVHCDMVTPQPYLTSGRRRVDRP